MTGFGSTSMKTTHRVGATSPGQLHVLMIMKCEPFELLWPVKL